MTLYTVNERSAVKRFFNWRSFRQDRIVIPLDQIQTVTASTKGFLRKLLRIGDLEIRTAGKGVLFQRIDGPLKVQKTVMTLKERVKKEATGRDRESLRNQLISRFSAGRENRILYKGSLAVFEEKVLPARRIFRKSAVFLLGQLFLPLLLITVGVVSPLLLSYPSSVWIKVPGLLFVSAGIFSALWIWIDWWNDIYKIELPYIWDIERKPFGKEDIRKQTELGLVLNVTAVQKGILSLLFNYGNVEIETAGRGDPLVFFTVHKPFEVQLDLLNYRDHFLRMKEKSLRETARKELVEFSEILEQAKQRGSR